MSDYELRNAFDEKTRYSKAKITPRMVATRFHEMVAWEHYSWIPEHILKHTSDNLELRSKITRTDIRQLYDAAIKRVVAREGLEAPDAPHGHRILFHIADDARLSPSVTAHYVHDRFLKALDEDKVSEAFYLFQSTEMTKQLRAAFSPQDVSTVFLRAYAGEEMRLIPEILETTRYDFDCRSKITPGMFGQAFRSCLRLAENSENPRHFAYTAIWMLGNSIGDNRLRSGINQADIDRLTGFYSIDRLAPLYARLFVLPNPERAQNWAKEEAAERAEQIEVFTLDAPTPDAVQRLCEHFGNIARRPGIIGARREAHATARAVAHYCPAIAA